MCLMAFIDDYKEQEQVIKGICAKWEMTYYYKRKSTHLIPNTQL